MFAAAQASFTQKSIQLADALPADPMLFWAPSEISAPAVRSHALLSNNFVQGIMLQIGLATVLHMHLLNSKSPSVS